MDEIAKVYSAGDRLYETDKKDVIILKVGYKKALLALQLLCLYKKQYKDRDSG